MNAPLSPAVMLDAIRRERERRAASASLYEFVKQAWPVMEPGVEFVPSWHIEVICEHLEAVSAREITRLLINIPPRHSKSTIVSVAWPIWEWITSPQEKFLCASYSGALSIRDNLKAYATISYRDIAAVAYDMGRTKLATMLLEFEPRPADRVGVWRRREA